MTATAAGRDTAGPAVVAVAIASGVVGFTTTAVTVGTRGMAAELSLSTIELGWTVNAFLVAAAALVLIGGRLGDVIGRLRTFQLGLTTFTVASLVGIVAPGLWVLVGARVGQGIGAALILPASIEVIADHEPGERAGRGFRWRGLVYASSFAIGPLVGGMLTDWYSWRWIFVVDVVAALVALLVSLPLIGTHGHDHGSATRDLVGAALVAVLVSMVIVFAERLAVWEVVSIRFGLAVAACAVVAALLVHHERRAQHPLLHPFIVRDHRVLGANVATVGASLGMLSLLYFFNLFAQSAATFSAGAMSVVAALIPFLLSMLLCALFSQWLGHRIGPRGPVTVGLLLMVAGFGLLTIVTPDTTKLDLLVPLTLAGIGAGIANASLTGIAVLDLPAGRMNEAAGRISLSRFLGSAMALAVGTATFLSVAATGAVARGVSGVAPPNADAAGRAADAQDRGDAFDLAITTLDRDLSGPLTAATEATTTERFARTMGLTAVVMAVFAGLAWWLLRPEPPRVRRTRRERPR